MNLSSQHPEYQAMVYGMKAGHLPATAQDIALVENPAPPAESYHPCSNYENAHPDFVAYCEYARSLGYLR